MARSPLALTYVTGDTKGHLPGISNDAPKEIRPTDKYFYEKLPNRPPQGSLTQSELLEDYGAPGALPTPPLFGGLNDGTLLPSGQTFPSSTATRTDALNHVQLFEEVWSVPRVIETIAKLSGIRGVPFELKVEIMKATKRFAQKRERVLLSNQAGVTQTGTTPARMKGFFQLVTTNVNRSDSGGQPADITSVDMAALNQTILKIYRAGGGNKKFIFLPPEVIQTWATNFQPLPGHRIADQPGSEETLNQVVKAMSHPSGVDTVWVSHRVMTTQAIAIVDFEQSCKKILEPFGVFYWKDGRRDLDGWVDETLTALYGQEAASGGWYTSSVIDASGGS